ncbi:AlpA family phage regulatory protein [Desulfovibrio sp. OttesenSCG-928-A18]|nr:AlpA family phage regulatory protein [Desulfovibrio sp. OttesenSCG-928-A18]
MTTTSYQSIPVTGFVRIRQILAVIPVSASTWWAGVAAGKFPKPIKLGHRTTVWRAEDIHSLIETLGQGNALLASSNNKASGQQ